MEEVIGINRFANYLKGDIAMKNLLLFGTATLFLAGCINSSTNFSNRGVTYQVTPELNGERAYVSGSPTTNDATVNAEKKFESDSKTNVAQTLQDSSTNSQKNNQTVEPEKQEEKPAEEQKEQK